MNFRLLLLPLTLLSPTIQRALPVIRISLSSQPIGPYVYQNDDVPLNLTLQAITAHSNIRERLSVGVGKEYTYFSTTAAHSIKAREKQNITFTLPLKSMLKTSGIHGKLEILSSSSTALASYEFNLKPISSKTIDPHSYLTSNYSVKDVVITPTKYETNNTESFRFDGFIDYFNVNNYYRLDLNDLSMSYDCFLDFPGATCYFCFTDTDNVFPYLHSGKEKAFRIPISVFAKEGRICFDFASIMYVKPGTLEMSLKARPGFVSTNYFYLPINKKSQLLDRNFELRVTDFGYGKTKFNWLIRYTNNRNLIGECSSSDYCVVGEID